MPQHPNRWYMKHKLHLPSKLLLYNAEMMTKINRLKSWTPSHPPKYCGTSQATHFQLKGSICIPGEHLFSPALWYYRQETASSSLVSTCGLQFNHHPFPSTIFLSLHPLINVRCAPVMLHHTSGKVTRVSASPATKVTVSLALVRRLLQWEEEYLSSFVIWKRSLTK